MRVATTHEQGQEAFDRAQEAFDLTMNFYDKLGRPSFKGLCAILNLPGHEDMDEGDGCMRTILLEVAEMDSFDTTVLDRVYPEVNGETA